MTTELNQKTQLETILDEFVKINVYMQVLHQKLEKQQDPTTKVLSGEIIDIIEKVIL